jgi:glycerate 2-kinase
MLLAVGKASAGMTRAALDVLAGYPIYGILVAPKGEEVGTFRGHIDVFRAGHPYPDDDGLQASHHVIRAINRMQVDELLLCLISGGASAMLPAPPAGVSLRQKRKVTELLVKSKATIHEVNTVRRHLSRLKGGRLVEQCHASLILSLIISDVPGNHLPDIASGMTVADPTTYETAVMVLTRHSLWSKIPSQVKVHLKKGLRSSIQETPKPGTPSFRRVHNFIIADNRTACVTAKNILTANQIPTIILTSTAEMEARAMGKLLASVATQSRRHGDPFSRSGALIIGGETTVDVRGKGTGGRNQESALSAVDGLADLDGTIVACLATDGIDGTSNAAGAIVDGRSAQRAKRIRISPDEFMAKNDSYRFFRRLNDNIFTGRTGTNVGDIYLLVSCN